MPALNIGDRIKVNWEINSQYYPGRVSSAFDKDTFRVNLDNCNLEWFNLIPATLRYASSAFYCPISPWTNCWVWWVARPRRDTAPLWVLHFFVQLRRASQLPAEKMYYQEGSAFLNLYVAFPLGKYLSTQILLTPTCCTRSNKLTIRSSLLKHALPELERRLTLHRATHGLWDISYNWCAHAPLCCCSPPVSALWAWRQVRLLENWLGTAQSIGHTASWESGLRQLFVAPSHCGIWTCQYHLQVSSQADSATAELSFSEALKVPQLSHPRSGSDANNAVIAKMVHDMIKNDPRNSFETFAVDFEHLFKLDTVRYSLGVLWFYGQNVRQNDDISIEINADDKPIEIECHPTSCLRLSAATELLTLVEKRSFMSVKSTIRLIEGNKYSLCTLFNSTMQQKLQKATIADLIAECNALRDVTVFGTTSLYVCPLHSRAAIRVLYSTDGSRAIEASQSAFIIELIVGDHTWEDFSSNEADVAQVTQTSALYYRHRDLFLQWGHQH